MASSAEDKQGQSDASASRDNHEGVQINGIAGLSGATSHPTGKTTASPNTHQSQPKHHQYRHPFPKSLCEQCDALEISPERFMISKIHQAPQSTTFQTSTASSRSLAQTLPLRSGTKDIELGNFRTISDRAQVCKLCALLIKSSLQYNLVDEARADQIFCQVRWEVDGHEFSAALLAPVAMNNRTRRLRIMWQAEGLQKREAFLVFVARTNPFAPNSDAFSHHRKERNFLGRDIEEEKGKQALMKSWMDLCKKYHGGSCQVKIAHAQEVSKLLDETYFGVIDTFDLQLKPLPRDSGGKPARYAALSYVWGKIEKPYVTVRANAPMHRIHGGLEPAKKKLPKALTDAIELVPKLGIRYLWIDCLCIVQDSTTSFRLNAQAMHAIYGNAYLTICAADGDNANVGLVAIHKSDIAGDSDQVSTEIVHGVRLQVSRPPEMVLRDSAWNRRAWTFQERMLSRRCLIFAEGRVYFQCRRTAMSEDIHNEATGTGWSLQSMDAPLRYLSEIGLRSLSFYMNSVSLFYQRKLTRPGDILAAYKGIESILEKNMHAPFCFGLPTSHFDFALLWQPTKAGVRRKPTSPHPQSACTQDDLGRCACQIVGDDFGGQEFPSWAWCGWTGGEVGYDSDTLEGCLINVREWLQEHTWIHWHIRDGRGRLRPLWDLMESGQDMSLETRWRGYIGLRAQGVDDQGTVDPSDESEDGDDDNPYQLNDRVESARVRMELQEQDVGEKVWRQPCAGVERPEPLHYLLKKSRTQTRKDPERERSHDAEEPSYRIERRIYEDYDYGGAQQQNRRDRDRRLVYSDSSEASPARTHRLSPNREPRLTISERPIDSWGRSNNLFSLPRFRNKDDFYAFLPENPYGVAKTDFQRNPSVEFPDMPILQFWTLRTSLQIVLVNSDIESGLSRCHVGDAAGDWCGTVTVNTDWLIPQGCRSKDGELFDFIAISQAKAFTDAEARVWNYYVPGERKDCIWQAFYCLIIERDQKKHVYERIGLGKVFQTAFNDASWDEIMLG